MAAYHKPSHGGKKKTTVSFVIRDKDETCHRSGVNALQYDTVLRRLYSAGRDSVIRVWDPDNASAPATQNGPQAGPSHYSHLHAMEHHTDWVNDIKLCYGGRNLISVSNDTTIKVWSAHQGFCLSTLRSHKDYAKCLAYAKERELVASAGFDRMIYLWDIQALTMLTATKNTVSTKPLDGSRDSIYSLAIDDSGTLVASGSTEKVIRLWDPRTRQKLLKLRGHTDNVRSLLFSRDGSLLLSASSDGSIRLWSIPQQRCLSIIRVHDGGVWTLQANESFNCVYSGGKDGKIFATDLRDTSSTTTICEEKRPILNMLLVSNDSLWVSTTDSTIKQWRINELVHHDDLGAGIGPAELKVAKDSLKTKPPNVLIAGKPAVIHHNILHDRRHILTFESDHSVVLYDVLTTRRLEVLHSAPDERSGRELYEQEIKRRSTMVYVPNWFSVDLKIGMLSIQLKETECLAAWVSAPDYNLLAHTDSQDLKINLGYLMLQALFEHWPPSYESQISSDSHTATNSNAHDSDRDFHNACQQHGPKLDQLAHRSLKNQAGFAARSSQRPGNRYFSIQGHTPIIISEGSQALFRFYAFDAAHENEETFLHEIMPAWISDIVISKCQPKFIKIPFFLQPHPNSGIKTLRKERLSASDMLQMRKVIDHVCEKMLVNVNEDSSDQQDGSRANSTSADTASVPSYDKVELYCNDQKLEVHLDLRTVKHLIWKSNDDLVLHYMPIK